MSAIIHGLEIPQEGFVEVLIRDDGTVQQTGKSYRIDGTDYYTPYVGEMPVVYKAVPIPPHGRLIDADKLIRNFQAMADNEWNKNCGATWSTGFLEAINMTEDAPTVIEAEEAKG